MARRDNIDAFRDAMPEGEEPKKKEDAKMSYLKGNYNLKKNVSGPETKKDEKPEDSSTKDFEKFAREKLGGSIAFVMKKDTFVWKGPEGDAPAADKPAEDGKKKG